MLLKSRYVIAIISILLVFLAVFYLSDILIYMVIAWVISMMGAPIVTFFTKYIGPTFSAVVSLGIIALAFILIIRIFIPPLVQQVRNLAAIDYEAMVDSLEEPFNDYEAWMIDKGLMDKKQEQTIDLEAEEQKKINEQINTKIVSIDSLLQESADSSGLRNVTLMVNVLPADADQLLDEEAEVNIDDLSILDRTKRGLAASLNPQRITSVFGTIFGFFSNILIAVFSIFFIAFFFLKEQGLVDKIISAIIPDKFEGKSLKAMDDATKLLIRYFLGILTQVTIITVFVSSLLGILSVKNALLIGFFAALMNIIPYIGPIIGASFAVIITVSSNLDLSFYDQMLPLLGKVVLVFALMQLLDNFLLQPFIFSKSVKAHPLEIFIIVLVGSKFGGVLGMVLAIPVYTVFRVLAKIFLSEFKVIQSITKSIE